MFEKWKQSGGSLKLVNYQMWTVFIEQTGSIEICPFISKIAVQVKVDHYEIIRVLLYINNNNNNIIIIV